MLKVRSNMQICYFKTQDQFSYLGAIHPSIFVKNKPVAFLVKEIVVFVHGALFGFIPIL